LPDPGLAKFIRPLKNEKDNSDKLLEAVYPALSPVRWKPIRKLHGHSRRNGVSLAFQGEDKGSDVVALDGTNLAYDNPRRSE
jgi:hypothetical protein